MLFHPKKVKLRSLRDFNANATEFKGYLQRIRKREKAGLINMIIIDGISQSGKTTFGRSICKTFDPNYVTVFKIIDLMRFLKSLKDRGEYKDYIWVLMDEPQNEADKLNYYDKRNQALMKIMSAYGFQHVNIVMCLPNVRRLSDSILVNLSMRITVVADYSDIKNKIIRKAYIKKAMWSDRKNKYIWITVEVHTIEDIEKDPVYEELKRKIYYENLEEWEHELNYYEKSYSDIKITMDDRGTIIYRSGLN